MVTKDEKVLNNVISLIYRFEKNKDEEEEEEENEEFDEDNYFNSINKWRIFGEKFVRNNENICTILYEGNEIKLRELLPYNDNNYKNDEFITIKLKENNYITYMTDMFKDCISLYSIPDISKLNTSKVTSMSGIFDNCRSLSYIYGLLKWDTSQVTDMSFMFNNCQSLSFLPDISKWDGSKVRKISKIFYNCKSLTFLPNIFKWNIPYYENLNIKNVYIKDWSNYDTNECINAINIIN